jgi:hypothetical protein
VIKTTAITSPKLVLNAIPVSIPSVTVQIGRQLYQDADRLRRLRENYSLTHILKRRGDSLSTRLRSTLNC